MTTKNPDEPTKEILQQWCHKIFVLSMENKYGDIIPLYNDLQLRFPEAKNPKSLLQLLKANNLLGKGACALFEMARASLVGINQSYGIAIKELDRGVEIAESFLAAIFEYKDAMQEHLLGEMIIYAADLFYLLNGQKDKAVHFLAKWIKYCRDARRQVLEDILKKHLEEIE